MGNPTHLETVEEFQEQKLGKFFSNAAEFNAAFQKLDFSNYNHSLLGTKDPMNGDDWKNSKQHTKRYDTFAEYTKDWYLYRNNVQIKLDLLNGYKSAEDALYDIEALPGLKTWKEKLEDLEEQFKDLLEEDEVLNNV